MKVLKLVAFAAGWAAVAACAQTYPVKAVRVINPYTPGGGVDALFRPLAHEGSRRLRHKAAPDFIVWASRRVASNPCSRIRARCCDSAD